MTTNIAQGTVHIEPHRGTKKYNPMIFGQFLEHFHRQVYGGVFEPNSFLSDERGFRLDVIEAMRELRVPIVRWPGGCFVSAYHWEDGVGSNRNPSYDKAWRVEDPNTFGTDEFIAWCRLIGAEPYICTNAGTGTPEEMSNWVEYCNLRDCGKWSRLRSSNGFQDPHHVKFWSIGNENYGEWEMGAKTAQEWGNFVLESAKMMRHVDDSIKLLAAAITDPDWTLNLLRRAGKYLDYISVHHYADTLWQHDTPSAYDSCLYHALEPEEAIQKAEQIIAVAGFQGQIKIAFDEWNLRGWHHPAGTNPEAIQARDRNDINATYTMADAVYSAGFLNTCLRHADTVQMANMAPVINTRGPLFVHKDGLVKRTTFHVLSMYANLLAENVGSTWVTSDLCITSRSVPGLDAIATCDDAMRTWRLALVNRFADLPLKCSVTLGQVPLEGKYQATTLCGDSTDAYNDVENPGRVAPQETQLLFTEGGTLLPPHSVTIVQIKV